MPETTDWPQVRLASDELMRGPWVYGRQVEPAAGVPDGALVAVEDASGRFVGHALYNSASDIRLRWLARGRKNALDRPGEFLHARLRAADELRRRLLALEQTTDAYRVAHAEGDDLPGLIVDRLGGVLVCEYHALGFLRLRAEVEAALARLYPGLPIVARVPDAAQRAERIAAADLPEPGTTGTVWITEHGLRYPVEPAGGHKTGWFCDQRDNRLRIGALARGRKVLDLFCNTGGFALQALRQGARAVRAVDLDEKALARARAAAAENGLALECVHADAFDVLRATAAEKESERPELIVCDPHKLIPSRAHLEAGRRKYLDLFALAFAATRPGGLVAAFSCSGALTLEAFLGTLFLAGRRAERGLRLLELMEAGPDHPQRPDWPRSRYLKGALLALDR
ncbi:MAG TPA: class I SAM-dependent rRNA methyltransferase [Planctomycetota bacterium]